MLDMCECVCVLDDLCMSRDTVGPDNLIGHATILFGVHACTQVVYANDTRPFPSHAPNKRKVKGRRCQTTHMLNQFTIMPPNASEN